MPIVTCIHWNVSAIATIGRPSASRMYFHTSQSVATATAPIQSSTRNPPTADRRPHATSSGSDQDLFIASNLFARRCQRGRRPHAEPEQPLRAGAGGQVAEQHLERPGKTDAEYARSGRDECGGNRRERETRTG